MLQICALEGFNGQRNLNWFGRVTGDFSEDLIFKLEHEKWVLAYFLMKYHSNFLNELWFE